jgi:hypothetical protein
VVETFQVCSHTRTTHTYITQPYQIYIAQLPDIDKFGIDVDLVLVRSPVVEHTPSS